MQRISLAFACALFAAGHASAATIEIDVPDEAAVGTIEAAYACPDREIAVTYHNAGDNALAVLRFGDETVVMANVLSGSGARYAGRQYVWWTRGDEADLYDEMQPDAKPVSCAVKE